MSNSWARPLIASYLQPTLCEGDTLCLRQYSKHPTLITKTDVSIIICSGQLLYFLYTCTNTIIFLFFIGASQQIERLMSGTIGNVTSLKCRGIQGCHLLTLGERMRSEGYGTWSVCLSVCLCVRLSPLIFALQAPNRLMSATNGSSATSAQKIMWQFR